MDNVLLPREVDLDKCISLDSTFKDARLDLSHLERLADSCVAIKGEVLADVSFSKDMNGMRMVRGSAHAEVVLICQRCNQEYVQSLELEFDLSPDLEQAKACHLENRYDFIELNEAGKLDLYELIEDGLILAIPTIPRHEQDDSDCALQGDNWSYGELDEAASESPFAALAALKGNLK